MILRTLALSAAATGLLLFTIPSIAHSTAHHGQKMHRTQLSVKKININTVDEATLQQVKGIGPHRAKLIIAYRKANGPFKSIDDLTSVKGVGEKMLDKIRSELSVK